MNHTVKETEDFFRSFHVPQGKEELLFCVPFTDLPAAGKLLAGTGISWGAENVYPEDHGAFTGEISPGMLRELGCTYVICGHSERRQILGESDELIARKVRTVFHNSMIPILCVGETLEERNSGQTEDFIRSQLDTALFDLTPDEVSRMVIAYEPIWAIGSGKASTPENAEEISSFIRRVVRTRAGDAADSVRILYGGSVRESNVVSFLQEKDIDGALIGGASLDPVEMTGIYQKACSISK